MRVSPGWADKHVEVFAWWNFSVWMKSIEEDICLGSKPQYPEHTAPVLHKGELWQPNTPVSVSPSTEDGTFPERCSFTLKGKQQWTAAVLEPGVTFENRATMMNWVLKRDTCQSKQNLHLFALSYITLDSTDSR